jgi:hypothetical protein
MAAPRLTVQFGFAHRQSAGVGLVGGRAPPG